MMDGLVKITKEEFDEHFENCPDFLCVLVPEFYHTIVMRSTSSEIVAYKDFNGECFSRTCYWRVS